MDKKPIFISHSSEDEELTEEFVDALIELGVSKDAIFFSAKTHMGVGVGKRFTEVILQHLHDSRLIFLLLTPNYYRSYNCQHEEGAAWYCMNEKTVYPIRIGIEYDDMKGFLDSTVIAIDPDQNKMHNIPHVLKSMNFIDDVPEEKTHFDKFIEKAIMVPTEHIPEKMIPSMIAHNSSFDNNDDINIEQPEQRTLKSITDNVPDYILLLFSCLKDQYITDMGDRWLSNTTIQYIKKWEELKHLDDTLSSNYYNALRFMINNSYVHPIEYTSYNNTRLHAINDDFKDKLRNLHPEELEKIEMTLKNHHIS